MQQNNRLNPLVQHLYTNGLPKIEFIRRNNESKEHPFSHDFITNIFHNKFHILDEYTADAESNQWCSLGSAFLTLNDIRSARKFKFGCETDIQSGAKLFLNDIIALLGQEESMDVLSEYAVVNGRDSEYQPGLADFCSVYSDGTPVLFECVASPVHGTVDTDAGAILDNPKAFGKIYDHLVNMQQFHGAIDVFGVVTTLKHWRFVWLPGSNSLAAATTLPHTGAAGPAMFQSRMKTHTSTSTAVPLPTALPLLAENVRSLSVSQIIPQNTPELPRLLMSLIRKAQHTKCRPVSLLTAHRLYVVLMQDTWRWLRPAQALVDELANKLTLHLGAPAPENAEYLVLKYLQLGAMYKVWLTCICTAESAGTICVVKQFESLDAGAREARLWQQLNHTPRVACRVIAGKHAVVMPFAIHAHVDDGEDNTRRIYFSFNAARWALQDKVVPGDLPATLTAMAAAAVQAMAVARNLLNPRKVALQAVARAAALGLLHEDLEWWHIALIPQFNEGGELVDLLPGLIDLESVLEGQDPTVALNKMTARIDEMCADVTAFSEE